jgi:hypothetical protein
MKTKKRRYKGELAKPIYVGSIPIEGANEKQQECIEQVIEQEAIEKLPLLMEHYKIPNKDDYFSLVLALARVHVPGFQVKRAALKLKHGNWGAVIRDNIGHPTIWPPERRLKLLNAVEETKQRHGLSTDREALEILMQKREWRPPANHRGDQKQWLETLESRHQDAKREERGGGPALDPASAAILRELEAEVVRLATATAPAATVYATLPLELRFAALCLSFSIEQSSGN